MTLFFKHNLNSICFSNLIPVSNSAVLHALEVRRAVQSDNYVKFFRLYKTTPNLGNCLLDMMLFSWRLQAAMKIVKAYKPSVEMLHVASALGFDNVKDCEEFIRGAGGQFIHTPANDGSGVEVLSLDTKNSTAINSNTAVKQDQLLL